MYKIIKMHVLFRYQNGKHSDMCRYLQGDKSMICKPLFCVTLHISSKWYPSLHIVNRHCECDTTPCSAC